MHAAALWSGPTIYFVVLQGLIKNLLEISFNLHYDTKRTSEVTQRSLEFT